MSNFVLLYKGGTVPQAEEDQKAMLAAWAKWYETLGKAVVDGGNPFSSAHTVGTDGTVGDGAASDLSGYTIIRAENLDAAMALVQECPMRQNGTVVEVYETFPTETRSSQSEGSGPKNSDESSEDSGDEAEAEPESESEADED